MSPRRLTLAAVLLFLVGLLAAPVLVGQTSGTTVKPSAKTRLDVTERAVASPDSVEIPVRWVLTNGAGVDSVTQAWGWSGGDTRARAFGPVRVPKMADGATGTRWRVIPKARAGATVRVWACHYLWRGGKLAGDTTGYCGSRQRVSVLGDPTGVRQMVPPGRTGSGTMQVVVVVNLPTRTRAQLLACSAAAQAQDDPVRALDACRNALALPVSDTGLPAYVACAYAADTGGVVWVHRSRSAGQLCQPLFDLVRNGNP